MPRTYGPRDMIALVIPRIGDNKVNMKKDSLCGWGRRESSLSLESFEAVFKCPKMEEESGVGAHPCTLKGEVLQIESVMKEGGANL